MSDNMKRWDAAIAWQNAFAIERWAHEMPRLKFPSHWIVQVIPPFGGAIVRFVIYYKKRSVSVYFDAFDQLGCFGETHWDAYPIDGDNVRWPMKDWPKMFRAIDRELKAKGKQ